MARLVLFAFVFTIACSAQSRRSAAGCAGAAPFYGLELESRDTMNLLTGLRQLDTLVSYAQARSLVAESRKAMARYSDSTGPVFSRMMVSRIFPYWYGTPWDFNGYSAVPGQGKIACGYFVSTTLLHAGLDVDRYKLAKQLPVHEAMSLACGGPVGVVEHESLDHCIFSLDSLTAEGLYFLGFAQSHAGFLLKYEGQLFVIHANYIGDSGVTVEPVKESIAFASFRTFYLVPLSNNQALMSKWLSGSAVTVIEE